MKDEIPVNGYGFIDMNSVPVNEKIIFPIQEDV